MRNPAVLRGFRRRFGTFVSFNTTLISNRSILLQGCFNAFRVRNKLFFCLKPAHADSSFLFCRYSALSGRRQQKAFVFPACSFGLKILQTSKQATSCLTGKYIFFYANRSREKKGYSTTAARNEPLAKIKRGGLFQSTTKYNSHALCVRTRRTVLL